MLPLWIWDCLMWSTTLGETNCNRCFNIHQIGTTPSSYPYHTRHNRQKHCCHLEEDGDCIGFPLIGYGSLLIGRQGCCSSQWPWCSDFNNQLKTMAKLIPHHPAVLRTTDSKEAQLLHAESWHPETIKSAQDVYACRLKTMSKTMYAVTWCLNMLSTLSSRFLSILAMEAARAASFSFLSLPTFVKRLVISSKVNDKTFLDL